MSRLSITLLIALMLSSTWAQTKEPGTPAHEGAQPNWLLRIKENVADLLAAQQDVAPTPVVLRWKARRIWDGRLAGPLLDLAAVDLTNDGSDEVIALTSTSLLMLSRRRGLFGVRRQVALTGSLAQQRSRDSIGLVAVARRGVHSARTGQGGVQIRARSSEREMGAAYRWDSTGFRKTSEFFGYPLCISATIRAAKGRNFFLGASVLWSNEGGPALGERLSALGCSRPQVNERGAPVRYLSEVGATGDLRVRCLDADADATSDADPKVCSQLQFSISGVGYAHLVADLDNDGMPEFVVTSARPQGIGDLLRVYAGTGGQGDEEALTLLYEREFAGGLVALEAGDFDGDGTLELLAAERDIHSGKTRLWLLN